MQALVAGSTVGRGEGNNVNLALSGFQVLGHAIPVAKIHPIQNREQNRTSGLAGFFLFYHVLFLWKATISHGMCQCKTPIGTSRSTLVFYHLVSEPWSQVCWGARLFLLFLGRQSSASGKFSFSVDFFGPAPPGACWNPKVKKKITEYQFFVTDFEGHLSKQGNFGGTQQTKLESNTAFICF